MAIFIVVPWAGERVAKVERLHVRLACRAAHVVVSASAVPNVEHVRFQRLASREKFFLESRVPRSAVARPELHASCKKRCPAGLHLQVKCRVLMGVAGAQRFARGCFVEQDRTGRYRDRISLASLRAHESATHRTGR
jgi:hypothetical protein